MNERFIRKRQDLLYILIGIGIAGLLQKVTPPPAENPLVELIHTTNTITEKIRALEPSPSVNPSSKASPTIIVTFPH